MRQNFMRALPLFAVIAACASDDAASNPGFDQWVGSRPVGWENSGEVRRVGSWHPNDYAVELVSDDASISQLNPGLDAHYTSCFAFALVAKIDPGARAYLELDFQDDSLIDFSQRIPESDWERRTFNILGPTWYDGLRFILRKAGPGMVILAEFRAQSNYGGCTTSARVVLSELADGARCDSADLCASGSCNSSGTCGDCPLDPDDAGADGCE